MDRIIEAHREAARLDTRSFDALLAEAQLCRPTRGFNKAVLGSQGIAVIGEVKRRSPSKGDLHIDLDPLALAQQYEAGGASCLSVLTDQDWFGGSQEDLMAAREAVALPVLRKDFTVDARDVLDARIMGADCVLLIVGALNDDDLLVFHELAEALEMDALVEIHDEAELDRAMMLGASLLGVNQRDLVTFEVDQARAIRMAAAMPDSLTLVAESGIRDRDDVLALSDAGFDAILVGETLVRSGDPENAVRELRGI